jgi:hypothetical protein
MERSKSQSEVWNELRRVLALAGEVLREIFDEAAYSRYLVRHEVAISADTYRAFLHEGEHARERKARCC